MTMFLFSYASSTPCQAVVNASVESLFYREMVVLVNSPISYAQEVAAETFPNSGLLVLSEEEEGGSRYLRLEEMYGIGDGTDTIVRRELAYISAKNDNVTKYDFNYWYLHVCRILSIFLNSF